MEGFYGVVNICRADDREGGRFGREKEYDSQRGREVWEREGA